MSSFRSIMMSKKVDWLLEKSALACIPIVLISIAVVQPLWLGIVLGFAFLVVAFYNVIVLINTELSEKENE